MQSSRAYKDHVNALLRNKAFLLSAIAICLLAALPYAYTLDGGFLYDDRFMILENPWLQDPARLTEAFTSNIWAVADVPTSNMYRPLLFIPLFVVYQLFGPWPPAFHALNVLYHALNSVLVMMAVGLMFERERDMGRTAFFAAALFALHPVHVEALNYPSDINELQRACFELGAFVFYASGRLGPSVAVYFLALFTKETSVTFPLVIAAYEALRGMRSPGLFVRRLAPFVLAAAFYLAVRAVVIGGVAPLMFEKGVTPWETVLTSVALAAAYVLKLLFPFNHSIYHSIIPVRSLADPRFLGSVAVLVCYSAALAVLYRRTRAACLPLFWVFIPLLPLLYYPVLGANDFAERYLYIPAMASSALMGLGMVRLGGRRGTAFFLIVAALFAVALLRENIRWEDPVTIWRRAVTASPASALPHYNLGYEYDIRDRYDEAAAEYLLALKRDPGHVKSHNNLGVIYARRGIYGPALDAFLASLRLAPLDPGTHINLGLLYMRMGNPEEAARSFRRALALAPQNGQARRNLELLTGRASP